MREWSEPGLEYLTKTEGVECGKKNYFRANQLLIPSSTHSRTLWEWGDYIQLKSICWSAEWRAMGPWIGRRGVEGEARSTKWKPPPTSRLWVRPCMFEQGAHGQRHKTARPVGTWSRGKRQSAGKCNLIKPAAEEMALASGREAVTSGKTIRRRKRERTNRSGEQINRKDTWKLAMKGRSIIWTKITP